MIIKSVKFRNFRSLQEVKVDFDSTTAFIGPNGVGKSTVLRGLDWFFNGDSQDIDEDDCFSGAQDREISVEVRFSNITEFDRELLGKYSATGVDEFVAIKTWDPVNGERLSANSQSFSPFNIVRSGGTASEKRERYKSLRAEQPKLELPPANTAKAIEMALLAWESKNPEKLSPAPQELSTDFFGFNGTSRMKRLFDYVFVSADLRASDESQDSKGSAISRILESVIQRSAADEEIKNLYDAQEVERKKVYERHFGESLAEVSSALTAELERYSSGRSVSISPEAQALKVPQTKFQVLVDDGDLRTTVDRQGHGFQRTLLISVLQMLAEVRKGNQIGTMFLSIEEPELFQHPIQERVFSAVLHELADGEEPVQVAYATHSPVFVDGDKFGNVRRLVRNPEDHSVEVFATDDQKIRDSVGNPPQLLGSDKLDRQFGKIVAKQLGSAFFAERVVLVEGSTDAAVINGLGDRKQVGLFEIRGVDVVGDLTKSAIPAMYEIITQLGIPCCAIIDNDAGMENRMRDKHEVKHGSRSGKGIDGNVKSSLRQRDELNESIRKFFANRDTEANCGSDLLFVEDTLESLLENDWPAWFREFEKMNQESDFDIFKNSNAYRQLTLQVQGEVPAAFLDIMQFSLGSIPV